MSRPEQIVSGVTAGSDGVLSKSIRRPRLRLWMLMVAVAVVAIAIPSTRSVLRERAERFQNKAQACHGHVILHSFRLGTHQRTSLLYSRSLHA